MHSSWTNIDFSIFAYLAHHRMLAYFLKCIGFISQNRQKSLSNINPDIIAWDLRKGIPFEDDTFDVVYSSHFIEHIERDSVANFIAECFRVLKHGGIIRIVVPNLLTIIESYLRTARLLENGNNNALQEHEETIKELFDQMVRIESTGTSEQNTLVRWVEHLYRGDAKRQGELHRWMYDKFTLGAILSKSGFIEIASFNADSSRIERWSQFNLDTNEDGCVYHPKSLYLEGIKI
jgi:SAM-dependent methyltransferase